LKALQKERRSKPSAREFVAEVHLLSAAARTLSLKAIYKAGEAAAQDTFRKMRWPETDGKAVCPDCGCCETCTITTRRKFKCKACLRQFPITSGAILASRKMAFVDLSAAICLTVNGSKGLSIVQLSRALGCQSKPLSCWPRSCAKRWLWKATREKC
jgi:hypothetical protein